MQPPGPGKLHAIPAAARLLRDPRAFIVENTRRYGPVWQTHFPDRGRLKSLVWLMGPEGNERILAPPHRDDFSWYEGYRFTMEPMFGRDILFLLDDEPHRRRHRALMPAFHPRTDADYVPAIERIVGAHTASWPRGEAIDLAQEMRRITFHVVANLLLGAADEEIAPLSALFEELGLGLFSVFRVALPGFRFHRGARARRALARFLADRIASYRRSGAAPPANMLGQLMQSETQDGAPLPDDSLIAEMLALLFSGYDTASSMLTSFWVALAGRPDVHEAVRGEVLAMPGADAAAAGSPWLDAALLETERLEPPLAFAMRGTLRDIDFQGYRIAAGSKVAYSAYYTGRVERLWERPEAFLPERFLDGKRPPPYALLGFGGGHRACIGKRFAGIEMRLIIGAILRELRLEFLPDQPPGFFFNPTLQRKHGFLARVS